MPNNPLKPSVSLLAKLGSLITHADEFMSPNGHPFDKAEFEQLLGNTEVLEWLTNMDKMGFLPKKRKNR